MQVCQKCVLDDFSPGIRFDEDGICNFCSSLKIDKQQETKKKYEKKFQDIVQKFRGKNSYDCLVAFSGGKDSTYTLKLMKEKYGLKILAITFDNWFQSERAQLNIRNVLKFINVDHFTILVNQESFNKIIYACLPQDLYAIKTLQRATTICTTCLSMIRFLCFKLAIEKEIPLVVLGMSPGQSPVVTSLFKTNASMLRKMQGAIYNPLFNRVGNIINPYFLEERHFIQENHFPYTINPLAFSDYNEDKMIEAIQKLGWEKPSDTDANSTNCLLNAFANQIHIDKFNFHPYAFEIAGLVREGYISRKDGIERVSASNNQEIIDYVKKKLEI